MGLAGGEERRGGGRSEGRKGELERGREKERQRERGKKRASEREIEIVLLSILSILSYLILSY